MSNTPDSPEQRPAPAPPAPFCTTHWTQVLAARGRSPEAREALRELCTAYYEPIVAFLARSERETEARDVAHEFFGILLNGDPLARVERDGGISAVVQASPGNTGPTAAGTVTPSGLDDPHSDHLAFRTDERSLLFTAWGRTTGEGDGRSDEDAGGGDCRAAAHAAIMCLRE